MLLCHADHERLDLFCSPRPAKLSPLHAAVKLLGNQTLVPPQEGVGGDKGVELFQALPPERMGERS